MPQPAEVLIINHYHTQLVVNSAQNQTSHIRYTPVCDSFGFHLFAVRTITATVLILYSDDKTNILNYHAALVILWYSLTYSPASQTCNISKLRKTTNITFTWYDVNHIHRVLSVFINYQHKISQLTGSSSPIRSFSNVDLPTPLGPTMATATRY